MASRSEILKEYKEWKEEVDTRITVIDKFEQVREKILSMVGSPAIDIIKNITARWDDMDSVEHIATSAAVRSIREVRVRPNDHTISKIELAPEKESMSLLFSIDKWYECRLWEIPFVFDINGETGIHYDDLQNLREILKSGHL